MKVSEHFLASIDVTVKRKMRKKKINFPFIPKVKKKRNDQDHELQFPFIINNIKRNDCKNYYLIKNF
jgi:hypothetical protein